MLGGVEGFERRGLVVARGVVSLKRRCGKVDGRLVTCDGQRKRSAFPVKASGEALVPWKNAYKRRLIDRPTSEGFVLSSATAFRGPSAMT